MAASDKIGVDRGGADANEHGEIMRIQTFGGTDIDRRIAAQAIADEMRVNGSRRQDHGDGDAVGSDILVGQEQLRLAHADSFNGLFANAGNGCAQAFLSGRDVIGAVNLGGDGAKGGLQPVPFGRGQNGAFQHQNVGILALSRPVYWQGLKSVSSGSSHAVRARSRSAGW